MSTWIKEGDHRIAELTEHAPGFYLVSTELMHQLMRELGWKPQDEEPIEVWRV